MGPGGGGGNVLVFLLYRDTGELGWDQEVNLLVLLIYRDAGELG